MSAGVVLPGGAALFAQGRPCRPDCSEAVGGAMSREPRQRRAKRGRSPTLTSSGAGGYLGKQDSATERSTYMTDAERSSCPSRRVRAAAQWGTRAASERRAGGCDACPRGYSRDLPATGTAICARGAEPGRAGGGSGARRGIHRSPAGIVDRARARTRTCPWREHQRRHGRGITGRAGGAGAAARWDYALRSSSSVTGWPARGWHRHMRCSCPHAGE